MSGVCGIYNYKTNRKIEDKQLRRLSDLVKHRGKFSSDIHINGEIGLAINSSNNRSAHSFGNAESSILGMLDGNIFNKKQLLCLIKEKCGFVSDESNISIITQLYKILGDDFIKIIDGEFALCVWDASEKKLILARNHSGNKPLYYYEGADGIIFASEIKSILSCNIKREIDPIALDAYFTFSYIPTPYTLFMGIKQIPAGSLLICKENELKIHPYWEFNKEKINTRISSVDCQEKLRELLSEAVNKRINNGNITGAFLSGGIDTTIVVYLMRKLLNKGFNVFTVGFDDVTFNEIPDAEKTAKFYDVKINKIIIDAKMGKAAISKVIWHTDLPFWDISAIPTYYGGLLASEQADLIITGDGSDQLLGGSDVYADWKKQYYLFPEFLRTRALASLVNLFNGINTKNVFLEKLLRNARIESFPLEQRYLIRSSLLTQEAKKEAYNNDFKNQILEDISLKINNRYFRKSNRSNFIDKLLYKDVLFFLHDDLLVKVDRMLSANSLEFRTPFLDIDLMNFISTIPVEYKIKGIFKPNKKYILKRAFQSYIPPHVLMRKKMGFSPPQRKWIKEDFKEIIISIYINGHFQYHLYSF